MATPVTNLRHLAVWTWLPALGELFMVALPFFWSVGAFGGSAPEVQKVKKPEAHVVNRTFSHAPVPLKQLGVLLGDGLPTEDSIEENADANRSTSSVSYPGPQSHASDLGHHLNMHHEPGIPRLRAPESIASGRYLPQSFREIPAYSPPSVEILRFGR